MHRLGRWGPELAAGRVAEQALTFSRRRARFARQALVNGAAGVVVTSRGRPVTVIAFTVKGNRIIEIDVVADPERLRQLDLRTLRLLGKDALPETN